MATNLPCDNHPTSQANMLITNLENGDTLTLCAFCIGQWARLLVGAFETEDTDDTAAGSTTEEAGQPEIAVATPDPEPKSEPAPPGAVTAWNEATAAIAQETETAGE